MLQRLFGVPVLSVLLWLAAGGQLLAEHRVLGEALAGVVAAIAYDNLTAAVARVLVGAPRVLRPRFAALVAHYAFEARFCRPGEGHELQRLGLVAEQEIRRSSPILWARAKPLK